MNEWAMYKPLLTALALPPVPFLLLVVVGALAVSWRRGLGYLMVMCGVAGIWLSACDGTALWLQNHVLRPVAALGPGDLTALSQRRDEAAIIVLGAGRDALAREYGMADLSANSAERLRYGVWLSRRTGLSLGFSGGLGWAQKSAGRGASEAEVAARVASDLYGVKLRWVESDSADTRQNAIRTMEMMMAQGMREVVLVTQAFHMPRAYKVFEQEAKRAAQRVKGAEAVRVTPAPMNFLSEAERPLLSWLPSSSGMRNVSFALRECLGLLVGA